MLGEFLEKNFVHARILVFVFDLTAPVLDTDVHAKEQVLLRLDKRIAKAAHRDCEMTLGGRCVEVLVEHLIGRGKYHTVLPIDATMFSSFSYHNSE